MTETIPDVIPKLSIYDGRYEYDAVEYALNNTLIKERFSRYLPTMLNRISGGNLSFLKELILNDTATEYSRSAAIEAVSIGVGIGNFDRNEVVGLLRQVLSNRASLTIYLKILNRPWRWP